MRGPIGRKKSVVKRTLGENIAFLEAEVERLRQCNGFFRRLEAALGPDVPLDKKIAAFKVLQEVAGEVMKRTIQDMTGHTQLRQDLAKLNDGIKDVVAKLKKG